ncbi:fimbrial protein [Phocaeicola salanitronis]|uniref:fimbrial protein n=1 Tax=Phocaeicola salanitronis TaxID=376805 RepID=UPI0023F67907|nr:fimbrial protein [Phocaeicola salanitronis]
MKEFENKIYRRLLAPVLACLVLALAGCSQDATEAEAPSSPTGGTYLTIVTRGINTTDYTQYEDYVGKLRVIAFDTDGNAVDGMNFTINNMEDFQVQGSGDEASIEVTHVFDSGIITSGVYTFYFVANEDDYNTTASQTLSTALDAVTDESTLNQILVATSMTTSGQVKPTALQMLMSTGPYTALIREGENNRIGDDNHIKLVRAFAKAQLALKLPNTTSSAPSNDDVTVTLSASIPNSFYLIPENTTEITGSISLTDRAISGGGTLFDAEGVSPDPFYVSETIYLPERYLANNNIEENALTYSITIGENNYSAPIADGTEDPVNYNIIRNYAYTTIGTYNPLTKVMSEFNLLVVPWVEKEITVPPFE